MTFEMLLDVPKIFKVRPRDDRLAEDGRFQDVVASPFGDCPAHKNHARGLEEAAQLADRIEQKNVRRGLRKLAAARPPQSGSFQLACGFFKPLRLPRSHNQTPPAQSLLGCD